MLSVLAIATLPSPRTMGSRLCKRASKGSVRGWGLGKASPGKAKKIARVVQITHVNRGLQTATALSKGRSVRVVVTAGLAEVILAAQDGSTGGALANRRRHNRVHGSASRPRRGDERRKREQQRQRGAAATLAGGPRNWEQEDQASQTVLAYQDSIRQNAASSSLAMQVEAPVVSPDPYRMPSVSPVPLAE